MALEGACKVGATPETWCPGCRVIFNYIVNSRPTWDAGDPVLKDKVNFSELSIPTLRRFLQKGCHDSEDSPSVHES